MLWLGSLECCWYYEISMIVDIRLGSKQDAADVCADK